MSDKSGGWKERAAVKEGEPHYLDVTASKLPFHCFAVGVCITLIFQSIPGLVLQDFSADAKHDGRNHHFNGLSGGLQPGLPITCDGHVSMWLCPTPAILKSKYLMTTYGLSSLREETNKPALIYRNDFSCFDPRGTRRVNEWSQVSSLTFPSVPRGCCRKVRWPKGNLVGHLLLNRRSAVQWSHPFHWTRSSARIEISPKMTEHPLRPTSQPTTRR